MNLEWTAPTYMHTHNKSKDWYWIVSIVTITFSILVSIFGDFVFGIFIIIAGASLLLHAHKIPNETTVTLNNKGVKVGNILYRYINIESFWVEDHELHPRIFLKSDKKLSPYIVILIDDENIDPDDVRLELLNHLPEVKHSEPFLEKLFIWLGF